MKQNQTFGFFKWWSWLILKLELIDLRRKFFFKFDTDKAQNNTGYLYEYTTFIFYLVIYASCAFTVFTATECYHCLADSWMLPLIINQMIKSKCKNYRYTVDYCRCRRYTMYALGTVKCCCSYILSRCSWDYIEQDQQDIIC